MADSSEQVIFRRGSLAIITGIVAGGYVLSRVLGIFINALSFNFQNFLHSTRTKIHAFKDFKNVPKNYKI
ncbi:MAG TPA: hypothetical protein EYQ00_00125 [Dehalococcoidia bacterium]|nr:hypothetical protein [Dehalococcoidia bacterium]